MNDNDKPLNATEEAMLEHLAGIVLSEGRSARMRDFLNFKVNDAAYTLHPGTIRNYMSHMVRLGKVAIDKKSSIAFYTLPGMTTDHTGVNGISQRRDLAAMLERLVFGRASMHNIRLRFTVPGIYATLSSLGTVGTLTTRKKSKDLVLKRMPLEKGLEAYVTVHTTDTVAVILACSEMPIRFDISGLVRLNSALTRVEERLRSLIDSAALRNTLTPQFSAVDLVVQSDYLRVPEYGAWLVVMWHVGADSLESYTGEKFEVTWELASGELVRVYSKSLKGKKTRRGRDLTGIRIEKQEQPRDLLHDAVERQLGAVLGRSGTVAA